MVDAGTTLTFQNVLTPTAVLSGTSQLSVQGGGTLVMAQPNTFTGSFTVNNDATLVKELEERGIGRPSTYAAILGTIQERQYVQKIGGKFVPTEIGLVVTDL